VIIPKLVGAIISVAKQSHYSVMSSKAFERNHQFCPTQQSFDGILLTICACQNHQSVIFKSLWGGNKNTTIYQAKPGKIQSRQAHLDVMSGMKQPSF
jgi:hypothetical protein